MRQRIVYTRHDGCVSVCCPSAEIFGIMQRGGYWNDRPHGFVEEQIRCQITAGIAPDHARRFAHAVAFGGVTEAEAWGIIRDRDCGRHGTQHELVDIAELPGRWFRDAWVRSHNGGPVSINLKKARRIQWSRIASQLEAENKKRAFDLFGAAPIKIDTLSVQGAIMAARDDEELRRVWPEGLPQC